MNEKGYVSVICEYNPFHRGHRYQIDRLKERFGGVVCIMSGNIVQRGSFAVADKYVRAEAALKNGANLVLELPIPWCCASARDFAAAGVHIADAIGMRSLAFGAESDLDMLLHIYNFISDAAVSEELQALSGVNKNISYPRMLKTLVAGALGDVYAEAVDKPNNILAMEYLRALQGRDIQPVVVRRAQEYRSSSQIRAFAEDTEKMLGMLPEESRAVFAQAAGTDFPRDPEKPDAFMIGTLRRMKYLGRIPTGIYATPDDLVRKIIAESLGSSTVSELSRKCADKIYTSARVRRSAVAIVFGITESRVHKMPSYTCVLAADDVGREILKSIKKTSKIDIITKPSHALLADGEVRDDFLFSKGIEDIAALSAPKPQPVNVGKTPIIYKEQK